MEWPWIFNWHWCLTKRLKANNTKSGTWNSLTEQCTIESKHITKVKANVVIKALYFMEKDEENYVGTSIYSQHKNKKSIYFSQ